MGAYSIIHSSTGRLADILAFFLGALAAGDLVTRFVHVDCIVLV
jgi:hypothetical protein